MDDAKDWSLAGAVIVPPGILERLMGERGITSEQLAAKAGIAPNTLASARRGRPVSVKTLRKLDAALGLFPVLNGPLGQELHRP